jgi:hypothetical protein
MEDDGDVSGHRFRATATQVAKGKEVTHVVSGGDGSARDAGGSGLASGVTEVTRSGKHVCATCHTPFRERGNEASIRVPRMFKSHVRPTIW